MSDTIKQAIEKLDREGNATGGYGGAPVIPIYNNLKKSVEANEELSIAILQESKHLKDCFEYVIQQMRNRVLERTDNQCVCATEEETYRISLEYWRIPNEKIESRQKAFDAEWRAADEIRRAAEQKKRDAESEKRKAKQKAKSKDGADEDEVEDEAPSQPKKPNKPESDQISMF
jgi:hypothetical protein